MKFNRWFINIVLALVVIGLYSWASEMNYQDESLSEELYCNDVALWESSNGERGHPDYNDRIDCGGR